MARLATLLAVLALAPSGLTACSSARAEKGSALLDFLDAHRP